MTTTSTEATVIPVPGTTDDAKLQPVLLRLQYCLETSSRIANVDAVIPVPRAERTSVNRSKMFTPLFIPVRPTARLI